MSQFSAKPCPLWDCVADAHRAIQVYAKRFPAGFYYRVERVNMSPDRGKTIIQMARIAVADDNGHCGYVPKFIEE